MEANKRLYRSNRNKMICGVCGGVAEYFNIDPTIVRLVFAILAFSWKGLLIYFLAAAFCRTNQLCSHKPKPRVYRSAL